MLKPAILTGILFWKPIRLDPDEVDLKPSKEDSLLREMVVQEDKYNFLETATSKANYALFPPLKGPFSERYNIKDKHFGVDIVASQNAPVKSVADGTVVFAGWTCRNRKCDHH